MIWLHTALALLSLLSSTSLINAAPTPSISCYPSASLTLLHPIKLASPQLAVKVIATGLTRPRHLLIDQDANILVIDSGRGIVSLTETTSCSGYEERLIVSDPDLNTGIALIGTSLYASTQDAAYVYDYDMSAFTASNRRTIVSGMANDDHNTRTLVLEPGEQPSYVIIGRGSNSNLDVDTQAGNRSQIRQFPLDGQSYDWSDGKLLSYGNRNCVGMTMAPNGLLYAVENSADNLESTTGIDVHNSNPAEEMNVIPLDAADPVNFGYPTCFTVWNGTVFGNSSLSTGSQFSIDTATPDSFCQDTANVRPPRLAFPAHYAPLDIKFTQSWNMTFDDDWRFSAYVTSHGSWDASPPVGYAVLRVPFDKDTWEPIADAPSNEGFETILSPPDLTQCPDNCFRPVGIAVERARSQRQNGLIISSDATGEIIRLYANPYR